MLNRHFLIMLTVCTLSSIELYAAAERTLAVCEGACSQESHILLAPQNIALIRAINDNADLKEDFLNSNAHVLECVWGQLTEGDLSSVEEAGKTFDEETVSCFSGTPFAFQTKRKSVPYLCSGFLLWTGIASCSPCCCASCTAAAGIPHLLHAMKKRSLPPYSFDTLTSAIVQDMQQRDRDHRDIWGEQGSLFSYWPHRNLNP
jgi:hypothetical protein